MRRTFRTAAGAMVAGKELSTDDRTVAVLHVVVDDDGTPRTYTLIENLGEPPSEWMDLIL